MAKETEEGVSVVAWPVNRTRHCHHHFAGVETEQKFHSASGTPKEQQALPVIIGFLCQLRQLAIAVDDIGITSLCRITYRIPHVRLARHNESSARLKGLMADILLLMSYFVCGVVEVRGVEDQLGITSSYQSFEPHTPSGVIVFGQGAMR